MSDFSVRSENVDVEQIMRQIRTRIREKRGVDYTEDEIRELANVKLEKFIDPKGVRSGLLEEYRRVSTPEPPAPNFAFGEDTMYETHRGPIRWLRALFRPLLKLLFNPNPLIQALHIQADLNTRNAERTARRAQLDALHYEVIHNLVVELTRTGVEVKSLKMRLESMASRLDFDERRARALEGVVQYRPGTVPPLQPPTGQDQGRPDHSRRDQGRRDQGQRNQGSRDQRPRDQGRPQGARDPRGPQSSVPQPHAPQSQVHQSTASQSAVPQSASALPTATESTAAESMPSRPDALPQGPGTARHGAPGPETQGPRDQGLQGNALDADGNERRARRRRRRGRRRPGDRAEGSPVGPTFPPSPEASVDRHSRGDGGRSAVAGDRTPSDAGSHPPTSAPERTTGAFGEASPGGEGRQEPDIRKEPVSSASARGSDSPSSGETSPKPPRGEGGPEPQRGEGG